MIKDHKQLKDVAKQIKAPFRVSIQITSKCNLNCIYCYFGDSNKGCISFNKIESIFEELNELGVFMIIIEGGEPFCHPEIIKILKKLEKYNFESIVTTNGTLIQDSMFPVLASFKKVHFQVSIDSINKKINDLCRGKTLETLKTIENFNKHSIDISLGIVISKQNIDECEDIINVYYPRIKKYNFLNVMPSKMSLTNQSLLKTTIGQRIACYKRLSIVKNNISELYIDIPFEFHDSRNKNAYSKEGCFAGYYFAVISPNLNVYPCDLKNIKMGNIEKDKFSDIWISEDAIKIRKANKKLCEREYLKWFSKNEEISINRCSV